jgi:beta-galactosidase/beta-glucuronidase
MHPRLLLNEKPYFFHGLLDQGYFQDGIYLPASPEGFLNDIKEMKALGFNTLRKHIKIEPDLFYYYCDREGMAVFQDFVNSGKYSFLIDTALPTIGLKKGITHSATKRRAEIFENTANDTVELLYNHPSVVYYTIFNEGWGQYEPQRIYEKMKSLDPSRIWDTTSGWFNNSESDVISEHVYFKKLKIKADKKNKKPLVLSEFGGYACKVKGHLFNEKKDYGYKFFDTPEKLQEALRVLYLNEVLPLIEKEGLSATILTQVSDVEDEINGLLTYDREVCKVDPKAMNDIADKLIKACK